MKRRAAALTAALVLLGSSSAAAAAPDASLLATDSVARLGGVSTELSGPAQYTGMGWSGMGTGLGMGYGTGTGYGMGMGYGAAMGYGLGTGMGYGSGMGYGLGTGLNAGLGLAYGGGFGTSSFGNWGGWWAAPPQLGMYPPGGPYPTAQTANFFLSQSQGNMYLNNSGYGSGGSLLNPIAPGASLTLEQLQNLGLGIAAPGTFTIGGAAYPLQPGATLGNTSLASLLGFPNQFFSGSPYTLGAYGLGLSR